MFWSSKAKDDNIYNYVGQKSGTKLLSLRNYYMLCSRPSYFKTMLLIFMKYLVGREIY
jgi:hypothetical protein